MKKKKEYSFKEIKSILPYQYPFLFIDKAALIKKGKKIICTKSVSGNEYYFVGHFKDNPVMPGAILMESMAQSAYLLGALSWDKEYSVCYLGGINDMRFIKPVYPGDQLTIEIEIKTRMKNAELVEAKAFVDSNLVCKGELIIVKR